MRPVILSVTIGITLTACNSDGGNVSPAPFQLAFTVQPGGATARQAIAPAVQVSIEDAAGRLITDADAPVTITLATSTSATLRGTTTVTSSSGVATFSDLQISRPGSGYKLSASSPDLSNALSQAFDIAPAPGVASTIVPVGALNQTGTVAQPVGTLPSVQVTDGLGSPVAGVGVTFEVKLGEGNVSGAKQLTGPDGIATVGEWILGTSAGNNALVATADGVDADPVIFTAQANAGGATAVALHGGDGQTTVVGTAVSEAPAVLVTDAYGNPVQGVTVTFRVASGGGSLTGAVQVSGADGIARADNWILGTVPRANTVAATAAKLNGSPVIIAATAATGRIVEARNNYFRSRHNGSGSPVTNTDIFGGAAVDTITRGQTVTWVWAGQNHNVTPGFSHDGSGTNEAPHTFSITFNAAGVYTYRCTNHSFIAYYFLDLAGMLGRIVVR